MRTPIILLGCALILLASCASGPAPNGGELSPDARGREDSPPPPVPDVTGRRIRLEWKSLNPRRNDPALGLINRTSPELTELYRNPAKYSHVKPVDDDTMGTLLEAFADEGFFDHAEKGRSLESLRTGEGHGVIWVGKGDESWALVFRPGMKGTPIPEIYVTLKNFIIHFHRRTLWLTPTTTSDPSRVFRVPAHTYPRRR